MCLAQASFAPCPRPFIVWLTNHITILTLTRASLQARQTMRHQANYCEPKRGLLRMVSCGSADPMERVVAQGRWCGASRGAKRTRTCSGAKGVVTGCTSNLRSWFALSVYWPHLNFSAGRKAMSTTIGVTKMAAFERPSVVERDYIEFLSGASSPNYGHNEPHLIAASRYPRIPGGHDAYGIASGDARRGDKRTIGRMTPRSLGSTAVGIHSAALTEYLMRDCMTHNCATTTEQRSALR
jgi:hypothetical protein